MNVYDDAHMYLHDHGLPDRSSAMRASAASPRGQHTAQSQESDESNATPAVTTPTFDIL